MSPLAQGAAGLAVALGFALLATGRTRGAAMLCVAQAVVVAIAALAQHHLGVAALELAEAAALGWLGGPPDHPASVRRISMRYLPQQPLHIPAILAAGAVLAALAATVPTAGLPLAVILLGLLMVAARPLPLHHALGIAAAQNGLALAALAIGLSGRSLALAVLPWLPALAFGALWLGSARTRTGVLRAPRIAAWADVGLSATVLLLACTLPWQPGAGAPFWRLDARAVHVILLLTILATAASWACRHTPPIWGSRLAILAGTVLAVASGAPLLSWLGMTLAAAGAVASTLPERAEAWRRLRLGCTGLVLALFGTIALHATLPALAAGACIMLGYGTLAVLAPELTVAAVALILRVRGAPTDDLLLVAGLTALLVAALGLGRGSAPHPVHIRTIPSAPRVVAGEGQAPTTLPSSTNVSRGWPAVARHDTGAGEVRAGHGPGASPGAPHGPQHLVLGLAGLAQAGAAVFAFGLGTDAGNLAGLLQLSLLALTQCALLLAHEDGVDRLAAIAGLAGVPPFGLFPSLALILAATANRLPWLLLPLGAGLAAVAWRLLLRLPNERRLLASPAWIPLALLLIAGFAMPEPLLAWFRLAAR